MHAFDPCKHFMKFLSEVSCQNLIYFPCLPKTAKAALSIPACLLIYVGESELDLHHLVTRKKMFSFFRKIYHHNML